MSKPSPVPDQVSKPYWDACGEDRLVMQTCGACNLMHYPPRRACDNCGSGELRPRGGDFVVWGSTPG